MRDIFTKETLITGEELTVIQGKGSDYFKALSKSKGDAGLTIKYLILDLTLLNGKKLEESALDEMDINVVGQIFELFNVMMSKIEGF